MRKNIPSLALNGLHEEGGHVLAMYLEYSLKGLDVVVANATLLAPATSKTQVSARDEKQTRKGTHIPGPWGPMFLRKGPKSFRASGSVLMLTMPMLFPKRDVSASPGQKKGPTSDLRASVEVVLYTENDRLVLLHSLDLIHHRHQRTGLSLAPSEQHAPCRPTSSPTSAPSRQPRHRCSSGGPSRTRSTR